MSAWDLPSSVTWRERAEECRNLADMFHNLEKRDRMLRVAADYARMADQAAERERAEAEEIQRKRPAS